MSGQASVEGILNALPKEELVELIVRLAAQDERLRDALMLQYGDGDYEERLAAYSKLIQSIVRKYAGREGFIHYRETYEFAMELLELLDSFDAGSDQRLEFEAALLVLKEGAAAFQYADDSDGDIGMLMEETLEHIRALVCQWDDRDIVLQQYAMNRLLEVSKSEVFQGWEEY